MERIRRDIPYAKQIEIIPLGDCHIGSPNARLDKVKNMVKYIRDTKNCYMIGMGDFFDAILATDPRYDQAETSEAFLDTLEMVIEIFAPIKEKIICLLMGNHEYKLRKIGFGDPVLHMCSNLNIPYGGISCFIRLRARPKTHKRPLIIYAHHGFFAGRKRGGKVNNIEDLASHYEASVYMCLTGDTKVITSEGITELKNVQIGDKVLDAGGKFQKVKNTINRIVDSFYQLKVLGGGQPLRGSGEHPILSLKKNVDIKRRRTAKRTLYNVINKPSYRPLKDLWVGDWVYIPIIKKNLPAPQSFLNLIFDEKVARFIGLYLAEGNVRPHGIQFSFNQKETEYIDFIDSMAKAMGLSMKKAFVENNKVIMLLINSKRLMLKMLQFGRGAHSKRMSPEMLFYPLDIQREIIRGIFEGDGCKIKKRKGEFALGTVSSEMAYQVASILLRLGYFPSVKMRHVFFKEKKFYLYIVTYSQGNPDSSRRKLNLHIPYEDGVLTRVTGIYKDNHKVKVYNLTVDNSNSYVANLIATHNCGHSHDLFSTRGVRIEWAGVKQKTFINTGSFVETASKGTSNYSERAGYPPQRLGVAKVKWYPRTEKVYVTE